MLSYVTQPANATKFHVDSKKIVVIGHSMGGFLAVAAMAQHPELTAGVIMTEGSPVNDAAGYFGGGADPTDYALTHAGSAVTYVHMDTDHGFSDHRIALEREVVEWVDSNVR